MKRTDTFYTPFAVEYTNEYPCYDYIYDNGGAIRSILHKSPDWAYEEEYRIVKPGGYGLSKVRPESLTSVIFGCQFDKTLFPQIRQSVQDAGFHPVLLEINWRREHVLKCEAYGSRSKTTMDECVGSSAAET